MNTFYKGDNKMKFFVCSDIHSAYTPWMKALKKAKFDENNPEHIIVVCGDAFDRMDESEEVFMFIMKMAAKEKIILIKGNHDTLLEDCCQRGFPYSHDWHNGTAKTISDIGGAAGGKTFEECCQITWNRMAEYRELLVNYFETKNYIFVHGFIPCEQYGEGYNPDKPWHQYNKTYKYNPNWRDSNDVEWEDSRWINGIQRAFDGICEPGKQIVIGHWHCSLAHKLAGNCDDEFNYAIWEPYYGNGIIAIDRCTAHTNKVNVIVLEDDFLE